MSPFNVPILQVHAITFFLVNVIVCSSVPVYKLPPTNIRRSSNNGNTEVLWRDSVVDNDDNFNSIEASSTSLKFPILLPFKTNNDAEYYSAPAKDSQSQRLERFYKHSHGESPPSEGVAQNKKDRIIFPDDDDYEDTGVPPSDEVDEQRAHTQSLDSLAHLVRQLLFRFSSTSTTDEGISPNFDLTSDLLPTDFETGSPTTTTEFTVSEHSLYSGPQLKTSGNDDECPFGFKRTRNGSCQKPSRRLASG